MIRRVAWSAVVILLCVAGPARSQAPKEAAKFAIDAAEKARIEAKSLELKAAIDAATAKFPKEKDPHGDFLADARVALVAVDRVLRFEEFRDTKDVDRALKALDLGLDRAAKLSAGEVPWTTTKGKTARGYVSKVDGSVQPYAVSVPDAYNGSDPIRLDVILHGRDAAISEVRFLDTHQGKPHPGDEPGLLLQVFGRGNNAYRWAGEADVFEAIEAVKRNYRVDASRILLRGFSMGGAGAWHLGLHHPGTWCAVEAGAGFTDTKKHAKIDTFPDYQEKMLPIYDAVAVARNAFDVPIAAYGGEDDPQLQASRNVIEALENLGVKLAKDGLVSRGEGIDFLHVVGARTGHKIDAPSAPILKKFRDDHAAKGLDPMPGKIRFVTYTLKYNKAHWISVEGLKEHYKPAIVEAEIVDDEVRVRSIENVTLLAVNRDAGEAIHFGDQEFPLRPAVGGLLPDVYFRKTEAGWSTLDYDQSRAFQEHAKPAKRHDLQGPIDDAFAGPFLVVVGTGTPWNPRVQAWADARLDRFRADWGRWMRGDLRIKKDVDVTPEDIEAFHLVLFGDPGSNALLGSIREALPATWTRESIDLGGRHPASDHALALIAPNPKNRYRYVVVNSGMTFGEAEFRGTNALLYPHLADWAVFRVANEQSEVKASGFFDESWKRP